MSGYCPWPGSEFCAGPGAAGGTAGGGAVVEPMWPSIGAIEDPSSIAPITIRMNGQVFELSLIHI